MKIVVAGCSHIFGSNLKDCDSVTSSKSTWPMLLYPDAINISKPGASPSTIARRVLMYLAYHSPKTIDGVIIQWPNLNRWESVSSDFDMTGEDWPYQTVGQHESHSYNNKATSNWKMQVAGTDLYNVHIQNLQTIIMLNSVLRANNIKCVNLLSNPISTDKRLEPDQQRTISKPKRFSIGDIRSWGFWNAIHSGLCQSFGITTNTDAGIKVADDDVFERVLMNELSLYKWLDFDSASWTEWAKKNDYERVNWHYVEQAHIDASKLLKDRIGQIFET